MLIALIVLSLAAQADEKVKQIQLELARKTLFTSPETSFEHGELALARAVSEKNDVNIALAARVMGQAKLNLNDYVGAAHYLSRAVLHAQKADDPFALSVSNRALGVLYELSLDYDRALEQYFLAKHYAEISNDNNAYALALNNIAYALTTMEAPEKALVYFVEADEIFIEEKDGANQANLRAGYGKALRLLKRYDEASSFLEQGLVLATQSEDWIAFDDIMVEMGLVALAQNHIAKAETAFQNIINSTHAVNYYQALAIAYIELGKIRQNEGKSKRAEEIYLEGLSRIHHGTTVEHELILLRALLSMTTDEAATIRLFNNYSNRLEEAFKFTQEGAIKRFETLKVLETQRKEISAQSKEISNMKRMVFAISLVVIILITFLIVVRRLVKLRHNAMQELAKKNEDLKVSREEILKVSRTDGLTGLNNRLFWDVCFEQEFDRLCRHGVAQSSVVIFDIDQFKKVNDTHGHAAGDQIIILVAEVLKEQMRKADLAGRYGGDEFVVLMPDTTPENAFNFAERLRKVVASKSVTYNNSKIQITVSLGVAAFTAGLPQREMWLDQADKALYKAKNSGRNKVWVAE